MTELTGEKPRLLIVDDSKVIRVTARKILRDHFETVEAVDGEDAWEILQNEPSFSLVVSDLTMPNLDGFGLLERMRNSDQPTIRNIPVVVITGANDSESTKARASEAGATDFIGKPFDSELLLSRTQAHASAGMADDTALLDELTGLANETAFNQRAGEQLSHAMRHGNIVSFMRIEIDNYDRLSAELGEEDSHEALKAVADILTASVRKEDVAARVDTASFSLLIPSIDETGAVSLAERIKSEIACLLNESVSIGIAASGTCDDPTTGGILALADRRLAEARNQGGNRVTAGSPAETKEETTQLVAEPVLPGEAVLAAEPEMVEAASATMTLCEPEPVAPEEEAGTGSMDFAAPAETMEALAPAAPAGDPLPQQHGGPAPDGRAFFEVNDPLPESSAGKADIPVLQDTVSQRAEFALPDEEPEDEEIVITAPFDIQFDNDPVAREPAQVSGAMDTTAQTRSSDDTITVVTSDDYDDDPVPRRRGLFRRKLRRLFGRSSD